MTATLPMTGTPRERVLYDWVRRVWLRVVAIDLGRPDDPVLSPVEPDAALEPELWPDGAPGVVLTDAPPREKGAVMADLALCLATYGQMTLSELAEVAGIDPHTAYTALRRREDLFYHTGHQRQARWHLVTNTANGACGQEKIIND